MFKGNSYLARLIRGIFRKEGDIRAKRKMMKENNPGKRNRMAKMDKKKNLKAGSETERVQLGWNMVSVWNVRRNLLSLIEVRRECATESTHENKLLSRGLT